ncbi:hypothetical protein ACWF94_16440 [Streptomyces sp. NPDC055078]
MKQNAAPEIRVVAFAGSVWGPYVGLPLHHTRNGIYRILFTRRTAQQIINNLSAEESGLTAAWEGDTLRLRWLPEYDGTGGTEAIPPDAHGRYAVGGPWAWADWCPFTSVADDAQRAIAQGAQEYATTPPSGESDDFYLYGRAEAYAVTLHHYQT